MTDTLHWHKSSHSGGSTNECVEVAETPRSVHVRDTQNRHHGHIDLSPAAFTAFLHAVRTEQL